MRERLDEIERAYEELTRELSAPEVTSDPARLRDLGKRHAELHGVVTAYRSLREATSHAEEARQMAKAEADPEMAAFLRSEEADAERRAAALEKELEALLLPKD